MSESSDGGTLVDRVLDRIKNNRLSAGVIVIGIAVISLASFTGAVKELRGILEGEHDNLSLKPTIVRFDAVPEQIQAGAEIALTWQAEGADRVVVDNGVGELPLSGSRRVAPTKTTIYTMTASNAGGSVTSASEVKVSTGIQFDAPLMLKDIFRGDAGWTHPQSDVYRGDIRDGRFLMENVQNRSATPATRAVAIGPHDDFLLEVSGTAVQPTDFYYGLCWFVAGGDAGYFLYVGPGPSSGGTYQLVRDETWLQTLANGTVLRHGASVNVLDRPTSTAGFRAATYRRERRQIPLLLCGWKTRSRSS
jgi:hypothetical protein